MLTSVSITINTANFYVSYPSYPNLVDSLQAVASTAYLCTDECFVIARQEEWRPQQD